MIVGVHLMNVNEQLTQSTANLFLEKVVTKNGQLLDGFDEVVENFLVAVNNVLHLLWSRDLTCVVIIIISVCVR